MKRVTVYWRNTPVEMELLSPIDHVRVGPDGEELITTDKGAQQITSIVRDHEEALWVDSTTDLDPHIAADLICQWASREKRPEQLRRLIRMASEEDEGTADALTEELEDLLRG